MRHASLRHIARFFCSILLIACVVWGGLQLWHKRHVRGVLRVVAVCAPDGIMHSDTTYTGLQYNLLRQMADSCNMQITITLYRTLDSCINALKHGDADLLTHALPGTTALRKQLNVTTPLYSDALYLIEADTAPHATNITALEGDTIYTESCSPYAQQLLALLDEAGLHCTVVTADSANNGTLATLLMQGSIQMIACNKLSAKALQQTYPTLHIGMTLGVQQPMVWTMTDHLQQADTINTWATQLKDLKALHRAIAESFGTH